MALVYEHRVYENDHGGRQHTTLFDLPNEILVHMLDCFQTQPLLQFKLVSHRFQNLINRIVHSRLLRAASLEDRKLILECYHPSAQYTEPYLYCDYLGTPGLSEYHEGEGLICQSADGPGRSGTIRKLYSHFRPTRKDLEPCVVRSHPAGDIPGSRTSEAASSRRLTREANFVKQHISLEAHELFSQLCFNASLVQMGPRRGVFLSNVDVVDRKCMRIWRPWLAEMAKNTRVSGSATGDDFLKAFDESLKDDEHGLDQTIWVDQNKMAGLRLRVKESKWRRDTPILVHQEEDDAVNYTLDLEEVIISTTHLMLAVERSLLETEQDSGRAMIFGSFATQSGQQGGDNIAN